LRQLFLLLDEREDEERRNDLRVYVLVNFLYNSQIPDKDRHKRVEPGDVFPSLKPLGSQKSRVIRSPRDLLPDVGARL
jgi:hypothetical protein